MIDFNDEERYVLNHYLSSGTTKEESCERLLFAAEATESRECTDLLMATCSKLRKLQPDEWDLLRASLPLNTSITDQDSDYTMEVET